MKRFFVPYKHRCTCLFFALMCCLVACGGTSDGTSSSSAPAARSGTSMTGAGSAGAVTTPPPGVHLGAQPCPEAVSETSHWDPIIGTQSGVDAVGRVICASLTNTTSLQALVVVFYEGTGHTADVYVFNTITNPSPTQIFKLQNLYKGDARISAYNTLLTSEVDQGSSLNLNKPNDALQQDLFREFKWSDGTGTLVPVSFPGIFPNLTRYEAESDQQKVNQGQMSWELNATAMADRLVAKLLNWSPTAPATIVSGGKQHDKDAIVAVKNTSAGGGAINIAMSRLEGNSNNGIWEATAAASDGLSITAPESRDRLNGTTTVTGTGNALAGKTGKVRVLDHLYTDIGNADVKSTSSSGNTTFSTNVSYTSSFKGGSQEGLVVLYSYSNGSDAISGAVILKELLSA